MKKEILEGLKAKFPGVSNSILEAMATTKAKAITTAEEVATYLEGVTFQQVLDTQAQQVTATAVANYEKKHGIKEGKPIEGNEPEPGGDPNKGKNPKPGDEEPEWAKKLNARFDLIEKAQTQSAAEKLITARKAQLKTVMEKAPAKVRERYEKDLSRMKFETEEDFTAWIDEVKTDTDALVADLAVKGAAFGRPRTGGNPGDADKPSAEVEARIKAREAEKASPAIQGLPS